MKDFGWYDSNVTHYLKMKRYITEYNMLFYTSYHPNEFWSIKTIVFALHNPTRQPSDQSEKLAIADGITLRSLPQLRVYEVSCFYAMPISWCLSDMYYQFLQRVYYASASVIHLPYHVTSQYYGRLTRYVQLRVAHAPTMPETFSPSPSSNC